jgi:hypothetical protein
MGKCTMFFVDPGPGWRYNVFEPVKAGNLK